MKRIAIFAHYDRDNLIDDYVVYYLSNLIKYVDKIIFCSDSNLGINESCKLNNLCEIAFSSKHGEYDFGSWKRGIEYCLNNKYFEDCDELVLCNDSCYGPIHEFDNFFDYVKKSTVDFVGLTNYEDNYRPYHLQSYFILYKQVIFKSKIFMEFYSNVCQEKEKIDVIEKYEIGFTQILRTNGFTCDVYLKNKINNVIFKNCFYDKYLYEYFFPLIKVSTFVSNPSHISNLSMHLKILRDKTNYPVEYIENHITRLSKSNNHLNLRAKVFDYEKDYLVIRSKYNKDLSKYSIMLRCFNVKVFYVNLPTKLVNYFFG